MRKKTADRARRPAAEPGPAQPVAGDQALPPPVPACATDVESLGPTSKPSKPLAPAASRPRLSPRRRFYFIVITLVAIGILQEALFRFVFPLPEVEDLNRLNYTKTYSFGSSISDKPKGGLSNVRIIWESEPDEFAFEHTLNLF